LALSGISHQLIRRGSRPTPTNHARAAAPAFVCPATCGWRLFLPAPCRLQRNVPPAKQLRQFEDSARLATCRRCDSCGARRTFYLARILVVDDDAAVQMTVRLLLERAGHSVVTADDGRKGLALCQVGGFDLLFLDIFMPGMDGFETMRMVRQHQPQLPIIVISGRPISPEAESGPDYLTMATKLGAVSSLQKPFR